MRVYTHGCYLNMSQLALPDCTNTMTPAIWRVTYCSSLGLKETVAGGHQHMMAKTIPPQMT